MSRAGRKRSKLTIALLLLPFSSSSSSSNLSPSLFHTPLPGMSEVSRSSSHEARLAAKTVFFLLLFVFKLAPRQSSWKWDVLLLIFEQADVSTLAVLGRVSLDFLSSTAPMLYKEAVVKETRQLEQLFCERKEDSKVTSTLLSVLASPLPSLTLFSLGSRLSCHHESMPSSPSLRSKLSPSTSPLSPSYHRTSASPPPASPHRPPYLSTTSRSSTKMGAE